MANYDEGWASIVEQCTPHVNTPAESTRATSLLFMSPAKRSNNALCKLETAVSELRNELKTFLKAPDETLEATMDAQRRVTNSVAIEILINSKARGSAKPEQRITDLAVLLAQAAAMNPHFQDAVAGWAGSIGTPTFQGAIKRRSRAIQKLFRSYRGQAAKLLDLVRASITFDTIDDVLWYGRPFIVVWTVHVVNSMSVLRHGACPNRWNRREAGLPSKLPVLVFARAGWLGFMWVVQRRIYHRHVCVGTSTRVRVCRQQVLPGATRRPVRGDPVRQEPVHGGSVDARHLRQHAERRLSQLCSLPPCRERGHHAPRGRRARMRATAWRQGH